MVGIIYSRSKEQSLAALLQELRPSPEEFRRMPVLVFSMPNLNLTERTVLGSLITGEPPADSGSGSDTVQSLIGTSEEKDAEAGTNPTLKDVPWSTVKTEIPEVILNLTVQHSKNNMRKLRNLMELEHVRILNPANSFNQHSVMEMLKSSPKTSRYVLEEIKVSKEDVFRFQESGNFIIKPRNGAYTGKTVYAKQIRTGFGLYNWNGVPYSTLFDIQEALFPMIGKGKWMILKCPELVTNRNRLLVLRSYLYRNPDGRWRVMLKTAVAKSEQAFRRTDIVTNDIILEIMQCINHYIADLTCCTIDLVFAKDGTPYFLNLGGWQYLNPGKKVYAPLFESLWQCVAAYAPQTNPQ